MDRRCDLLVKTIKDNKTIENVVSKELIINTRLITIVSESQSQNVFILGRSLLLQVARKIPSCDMVLSTVFITLIRTHSSRDIISSWTN